MEGFSYLSSKEPLGKLARDYFDALLEGKRQFASELILKAVADGEDIREIYLNVFQKTQYEIGLMWQLNKVDVAVEHYFTAATQLIMSQLYPYIFSTEKNGLKFVAANVTDELHELGLRMVADFLELDGWDTYYLGANTPKESIIQSLIEQKAHVLGISATMTFHVPKVADIIKGIRAQEELRHIKIMVGGNPFNQDPQLWATIGANGYAKDAKQAVLVANQLMQG